MSEEKPDPRATKARMKQLELCLTESLKAAEADPDKFGMERFGENSWLLDGRAIMGLMAMACGKWDGWGGR